MDKVKRAMSRDRMAEGTPERRSSIDCELVHSRNIRLFLSLAPFLFSRADKTLPFFAYSNDTGRTKR